ncbi:hypothetical protein [Brevundimonas sp. UBA7534]|uniref:hypothetical protein n=1 Tax=Brevundimonas sp. UBA7534 TaxID=1946138 RepID=UPI0025BA0840|nr:hypothetical protein [Brevundimonas sp. UBA7534]
MTGTASIPVWVGAAIGLIVAISLARLVLWRQAAPADQRSPLWRPALLMSLTVAAGALLHLTLFPPATPLRTGALVVATRGAPSVIATRPGDRLVALPEAGGVAGATRAPDLATALRRFPDAARLRIVGAGLDPRDRQPLPLAATYSPQPLPQGIIEVALPQPVAPGGAFNVAGRIGALAAGSVALVDPAGAVVDHEAVVAGAPFVLQSRARAAGQTLFELRLQNSAGRTIEKIDVPVDARPVSRPRILALEGAPNPETKYLRRWAQDADIDLRLQVDLGGGLQMGDPPGALTATGLRDVDLLVIDDRRWGGLSPQVRGAVTTAVREGMGLLLRPTGPLSGATQREWATLGFPLSGGGDAREVELARSPAAAASADPAARAETSAPLERRDFTLAGTETASLLRAADGTELAGWRPLGLGRVGVWTVADSYVLVLTGRGDTHGALWSALFSGLARPEPTRRLHVDGFPNAGVRLAACGVAADTVVIDPAGRESRLLIDPAAGDQACAAYWPQHAGWHVARAPDGAETAFYVHPREAGRSLQMFEARQATLQLLALSSARSSAPAAHEARGAAWPWFVALMAVLALLWTAERWRPKRAAFAH